MNVIASSRSAFTRVSVAAIITMTVALTESRAADSDHPLPTPPYVENCEPGVRGGRCVIAEFSDPKTFNPMTAGETSSTDICYRMFSGLVTVISPTEAIEPGLAESWSVEPDGRTWTFHLRKGLRWSDGHPLTADDVVFTVETMYNPDCPNPTVDQFRIKGKNFEIKKIDDLTVRVVTPEVYAPFLMFFGAGVYILPQHILAKHVADKSFTSAYGVDSKPESVVCSGPFRLKLYKSGQYTLLERNPEYYGVDKKGARLPYFDNVIFTVVPDQGAISLRMLHGEADLQPLVRPEEADHFKEEAAKGKIELLDLGLASMRDVLTFNQNPGSNLKTGKPLVDPVKLKWFRNTKFRQAISYAIDRDAIVKSALGGHGAPNYSFEPVQATTWYNPKIKTYPHDPARALALLAEIGIKKRDDGTLADSDGNPIAFTMNTNAGNDRRQKSGVIIQEDLKRLGINVTFQPLDFNLLIDKFDQTQDYELILLGWAGGPPDPAYSMNILKSDGFSHQWNRKQPKPSTDWEARMDVLMDAQLTTLDLAERKKYFDEVQEILAEQMPMIPTVSMEAYAACRANMGNIRGTTLDQNPLLWNLEQIYFKKK